MTDNISCSRRSNNLTTIRQIFVIGGEAAFILLSSFFIAAFGGTIRYLLA